MRKYQSARALQITVTLIIFVRIHANVKMLENVSNKMPSLRSAYNEKHSQHLNSCNRNFIPN